MMRLSEAASRGPRELFVVFEAHLRALHRTELAGVVRAADGFELLLVVRVDRLEV